MMEVRTSPQVIRQPFADGQGPAENSAGSSSTKTRTPETIYSEVDDSSNKVLKASRKFHTRTTGYERVDPGKRLPLTESDHRKKQITTESRTLKEQEAIIRIQSKKKESEVAYDCSLSTSKAFQVQRLYRHQQKTIEVLEDHIAALDQKMHQWDMDKYDPNDQDYQNWKLELNILLQCRIWSIERYYAINHDKKEKCSEDKLTKVKFVHERCRSDFRLGPEGIEYFDEDVDMSVFECLNNGEMNLTYVLGQTADDTTGIGLTRLKVNFPEGIQETVFYLLHDVVKDKLVKCQSLQKSSRNFQLYVIKQHISKCLLKTEGLTGAKLLTVTTSNDSKQRELRAQEKLPETKACSLSRGGSSEALNSEVNESRPNEIMGLEYEVPTTSTSPPSENSANSSEKSDSLLDSVSRRPPAVPPTMSARFRDKVRNLSDSQAFRADFEQNHPKDRTYEDPNDVSEVQTASIEPEDLKIQKLTQINASVVVAPSVTVPASGAETDELSNDVDTNSRKSRETVPLTQSDAPESIARSLKVALAHQNLDNIERYSAGVVVDIDASDLVEAPGTDDRYNDWAEVKAVSLEGVLDVVVTHQNTKAAQHLFNKGYLKKEELLNVLQAKNGPAKQASEKDNTKIAKLLIEKEAELTETTRFRVSLARGIRGLFKKFFKLVGGESTGSKSRVFSEKITKEDLKQAGGSGKSALQDAITKGQTETAWEIMEALNFELEGHLSAHDDIWSSMIKAKELKLFKLMLKKNGNNNPKNRYSGMGTSMNLRDYLDWSIGQCYLQDKETKDEWKKLIKETFGEKA